MARTRASNFDEKQQHILLSAAQVFAALGMEKASMSQIAVAAGVSKSLLYHYYPSKDELVFAIIFSHLEELNSRLEDAFDPELAPDKRLLQLVETVLEAYKGADNQHKVQLNAGPALIADQKQKIAALERKIVQHFSKTLSELQPDLNSPEKPLLKPVTMSLFGMLNWVYMWFRDDGALSRAEYAALATQLMLGGIKSVR